MPGKKLIGNIFTLGLIFVFILSPIRCDLLDFNGNKAEAMERWIIDQDTTWTKEENILVDKWVIIENGATLTIEKGATIYFTNPTTGDVYTPTIEVADGRILAEGTQDGKITFIPKNEEDQYGIIFYGQQSSQPSLFRYVNFEKGGYIPDYMLHNNKRNIFSKAYAFGLYEAPVIYYFSGKVHIENSEFNSSFSGDIEANTRLAADSRGDYFEVVNSNFKNSGNNTVISSKISCDPGYCDGKDKKVLLKNNFYGNFQGPTREGDSTTKGGKIIGNYTWEGYRNNDLISDPVIIIPGIMGSFEIGDKLVLDPIMKVYDNLVRSLDQNGYQENINLFKFPYEWRNGNEFTAGELRNKIQEIKDQTKVSKVDLVAHSMGGLISRSYIEEGNYQNDVDQLITIGTPHKGAPSAYFKWEAAEGFEDLLDMIGKKIFQVEAKHAGYDDLGKYIREKVVSVGELLPDYDYLEEKGVMKTYYTGYPRNEFLEGLNSQSNLANLKKVDFTNIISQSKSTVSKFRVVESEKEGKWEHGMPENYYNLRTDRGFEYNNGDETVPLESLTGIVSDKTIEIPDSTHSQLPSRAQCKILAELSNKTEGDCAYINDVSEIVSILTFGVFSPIDIQVVEMKTGKRIGKDFDDSGGGIVNEIDGAYYTGPGTENEFLTIPNPADGEYKILVQGTGSGGEYQIETAKIAEDPATGIAQESVAAIQGTAIAGQEEEKKIKVEGSKVLAENPDTIAPEISISSPEEDKTYQNNRILPVNYQVADNQSPAEKIRSQMSLDGIGFTGNNIDLALQNLGGHSLKIIATDEAGNSGEKENEFKAETNVEATMDNVNHYTALNLIKNKTDKTVLVSRLKLIQGIEELKKMIENSRFFSSKVKKNLTQASEEQINDQLDWLAKYVQQRSKVGASQGIDPKIGTLLIESLNFLRYD